MSKKKNIYIFRLLCGIVIYYILGQLGTFFSVPPVFSSAIWPASGFALGLMLLYGKKQWPGILIGAALTNYFIAHGYGLPINFVDLLVAILIGIGATLQALVGVVLLRYFNLYPTALNRWKSIVLFLFVAGMLSCLVNATFGNIVLWAFQIVPTQSILLNWITWWIGDVIGVVLFAPLMLILFAKPKHIWRNRILPIALPSAILFVGVVVLFYVSNISEYDQVNLKFNLKALALEKIINNSAVNLSSNNFQELVKSIENTMLDKQFSTIGIAIKDKSNNNPVYNNYPGLDESKVIYRNDAGLWFNNHPYLLSIYSTPAYTIQQYSKQVWITLLTALVYVCLLTILLWILNGQRNLIEITVDVRTKELKNANKKLKDSINSLDDFAYVASHDLKAPLRGITNLVSFIEEDGKEVLQDETRKYFDMIKESTSQMSTLIDSILQYSRAGKDELIQPESFSLHGLVDEIIRYLSSEKKVTVEQLNEDIRVNTYKIELQQVLQNLISNAIKFCDKGEVIIKLSAADAGNHYEFAVQDNGIGIDEKYHKKIFNLFSKLTEGNQSDTGIGLAIVKKLLNKHDQHIWLYSTPGEGTTFCFTWPKGVAE